MFIDVRNRAKLPLIRTSFHLSPTNGTGSLSHRTREATHNDVCYTLRTLHKGVTMENDVFVSDSSLSIEGHAESD